MSNSRSFLVKEEQEEINSTSLTKPSSENSDENRLEPQGLGYEEEKDVGEKKYEKYDHQYLSVVSPKEAAPSSSSSTRLELQELRKKEDIDKEQEKYDQPCLGDHQSEVADDDEGFKTPTSSDHKIPVISECPPAPKKSRPETSSTKRKLSPKVHRTLQLDLSEEVESMFPPPIQEDDASPNSKKARTTTDDEE